MGNTLLVEIFLLFNVFGLVYMTIDLPNCTIERSWKGIKVDCSSIGLDFFPDFCANYSDGFGLKLHNVSSNEITELDLSYNWIKTLGIIIFTV